MKNNKWLQFLFFFIAGVFFRWGALGFPMWIEISSYWVSSDALGTYNWINVMHEEGWIPPMPFYSHRLNFPEGLYLYSAPIIDSLQVSGLRVLRLFIESPLAVYNMYFILGAGFVCASMAFVALALGFSFPYAFGAGLLYSALPFAFERLHHLFLSAYYDVPVGIFLALSLASNISTRKAVGLSVLLGVSGLYYPFFSCSFISTAAVALLIKNWRSKDWVAIKKIGRNYLLAVVPCVLVIFLEALPTFLGTMKYGSSGGMTRSPNESLVWGLRFTNMTLPPTTHPWGLYDWVRPLFFSQSYLQEESIYEGFNEYIGIFALLGLAIGIFGLVRRKSIFQESALLSIGGIWFTLLGLRYGLGYLFALTVSPQIRSYNRVSIFIAAIGILLFFGWLNQQKRIPLKFQWPVTLLVLIMGIIDMGTFYRPANAKIDETKSDQEFARRIKETVGDSPIIKLPFGVFPEWPGYPSKESYAAFRQLAFEKIHSIFPAVKGSPESYRKVELFFGRIPHRQSMRDFGLRGVVIDRMDYDDQGKEAIQALSLKEALSFDSANGRFKFISL